MFYYSPEFGAVTDDIEGYISSLVAYTNYAYLNSDVRTVRMQACPKQ